VLFPQSIGLPCSYEISSYKEYGGLGHAEENPVIVDGGGGTAVDRERRLGAGILRHSQWRFAGGTKISSVPYTINNPGFYFFTGNLNYSSTTGNAITINADDVTLDLMGNTLTGPGAATGTVEAITMSGRTNVEVRNGTVRNFFVGVHDGDINNGKKHRALNLRVTTTTFGIIFDGKDHLIKNCSASENINTGLHIGTGLIVDSVANNNGIGIQLDGPGSALGNTACLNSSTNFRFGGAGLYPTSILVDRNSAYGLLINYAKSPSNSGGILITANNSGTP
jgi:hypothetical protein